MPELTQLQRSIRIMQRLLTHRETTVNELYELFERAEAKRTLQRTLLHIQSSNVPLRIRNGAHGEHYYSLPQAFSYIPVTLSADEVMAAMLLSQFSDLFKGTRIGRDIEGVLEKMEQLCPPDAVRITSSFGTYKEVLRVQQPGRVDISSRDEIMRNILEAIVKGNEYKVTYNNVYKKKKSEFLIHPYTLLFHAGSIYLIGYSPKHENWMRLAVQRIMEFEFTGQRFERQQDFNVEQLLYDAFGIWSEPPVDIKIRFDKVVAPSIQEKIWHHSQKSTRLEDGSLEMSLHVGPSAELIAWILRWGTFAEVLAPQSLRDQVGNIFHQGCKIYGYQPTNNDIQV